MIKIVLEIPSHHCSSLIRLIQCCDVISNTISIQFRFAIEKRHKRTCEESKNGEEPSGISAGVFVIGKLLLLPGLEPFTDPLIEPILLILEL
jgi:hypothetical protein